MLRGVAFACALVSVCSGALGSPDPRLPAVAEMLNASSYTLSRINSQVSSMKTNMADFADRQQKELAVLKDNMERQLAGEESENQGLQAMNEHITEDIWKLEKGNRKLRDQAKELQADNVELRKALTTVRARAGAVGDYVNRTLDVTTDVGDASLKVLERGENGQERTESRANATDTDADGETDAGFDRDAGDADADADQERGTDEDDKDGNNGESLIALRFQHRALRGNRALRSKHARETGESDKAEEELEEEEKGESDTAEDDDVNDSQDSEEQQDQTNENDSESLGVTSAGNPRSADDNVSQSLVHSLSEELRQLDKQDVESREQMSELFEVEFNNKKKVHANILSKQKALNGTRTSLTEVQHNLQNAVSHLEGTKGQLGRRLHGLGEYLQKLAALVSKPAPEAEHMIPSLPSDVAAFVQEQRRARGLTQVLPAAH